MGTATKQMSVADALFSKTRQAVLGLLLTHAGEAYHLREIFRIAGMGHGTVQRELKRLTAAGIIKRERRDKRTLYRANRECPIYRELQSLVSKAVLHGIPGRSRDPGLPPVSVNHVKPDRDKKIGTPT